MRVALIVNLRIPARDYGGTERVVTWLARGLAEHGHEVTILAPAGSTCESARVIEIPFVRGQERHLDLHPLLPLGIDVVHAHFPLHGPRELPFLWTLHGNARSGELLPDRTVALSADHARRHDLTDWVHNGLDPSEYRFGAIKKDTDLFLGRLHTVKGWHWALNGANRTGRRIIMAGGWRPSLRRNVQFVGKVAGGRKASLLAEAACLWMPALWDEPFGLTTIEAMVSGTPVLGTRRGALPEIITPESGAMGETLDELVALRASLDGMDPERVRARVLEAFTHRTMAANYERLYREAIGRG